MQHVEAVAAVVNERWAVRSAARGDAGGMVDEAGRAEGAGVGVSPGGGGMFGSGTSVNPSHQVAAGESGSLGAHCAARGNDRHEEQTDG